MAKQGTFEHPKTKRLARLIGMPSYGALGLLEAFWHWVGRYAPTGEITVEAMEDCAETIRFEKGGIELASVLLQSGWLDVLTPAEDGRYYVHDWHDHATDAVKKDLTRSGKVFANGSSVRKQKQVDTESDNVANVSRQDRDEVGTPQPNPTQPNPTIPNPAQPSPPQPAKKVKTSFSPSDGWSLITSSILIDDVAPLYDAWFNFAEHRKQLRAGNYTEVGLRTLLKQIKKCADEHLVDSGRLFQTAIEDSLSRGWKGIVNDKFPDYAKSLPKRKLSNDEANAWCDEVKVRL